jgi:hypothetical protein
MAILSRRLAEQKVIVGLNEAAIWPIKGADGGRFIAKIHQ